MMKSSQPLRPIQGIKIWMITKELNARKLAKQYGRNEAFVSLFLSRKRTSQKLVDYLIKEGCSEEFFKNGKVAA